MSGYDDFADSFDGGQDKLTELTDEILTEKVKVELARREDALAARDEDYDRELLADQIRDELYVEAQDEARDVLAANTPCCNDYHCPCH